MFTTKIKCLLGIGIGLVAGPQALAQAGKAPDPPPAQQASPASPAATPPEEKPPHIVESPAMQGRMPSGMPFPAGEPREGLAVLVKSFFAKIPTYPDIRFREFFDPRYLKKHGLENSDIAFEISKHQGITNLRVADDKQTVLVVLDYAGGGEELFLMHCEVHDGHLYISPANAPDPKTGIFKPWILRTRVH